MTAALTVTIPDTRLILADVRAARRTVGLVPTMGALHEGHGALIDMARQECDFLAVSIFVNPIQFDQRSDYDRYPRGIDADLDFCSARKVDLVFAPGVEEMYPEETKTFVEVRSVGDHLCGKFRPGHFRGVATVVLKLFEIVRPERAYFGEKDAQQLAVIRRLVKDLDVPVTIVGVPTVREPDGLALSSRNRRLDPGQRAAAAGLYRLLQAALAVISSGERGAAAVRTQALATAPPGPEVRIEYFEIVDTEMMQPVERIEGPVRIALAAWVGDTRLIDNVRWDG